MTNPTTPQLTESDVSEYEQRRYAAVRSYHSGDDVNWFLTVAIPALIRDWRALKTELERAHLARSALERFDEVQKANTRAAAENTALREQLAEVTKERNDWKQRAEEAEADF